MAEDNTQTKNTILAESFFPSLENNLKNGSHPLPYDLFQERKPLIFKKKTQLGAPQDISGRFMGFIHENAVADQALKGIVKIFPLCNDGSFRIIAAVLYHDDGASVTSDAITILRNFLCRRLSMASRTSCHDLLIVAATTLSDDCRPALSPPTILCIPNSFELWDIRLPQTNLTAETVEFLLHALPVSPETYADNLATVIGHWPNDSYIKKDALREKLAISPSIPDTFLEQWLNVLFARGGYAKDNRGYIYPPNTELPEGHGAQITKRYK
ncbi:MAG: hypothetical protein IKP58_03455 [Victivallales bacterium]|nr:hypothetical protein [Victivallales bacterium]